MNTSEVLQVFHPMEALERHLKSVPLVSYRLTWLIQFSQNSTQYFQSLMGKVDAVSQCPLPLRVIFFFSSGYRKKNEK